MSYVLSTAGCIALDRVNALLTMLGGFTLSDVELLLLCFARLKVGSPLDVWMFLHKQSNLSITAMDEDFIVAEQAALARDDLLEQVFEEAVALGYIVPVDTAC
jgi:hypothetical protein